MIYIIYIFILLLFFSNLKSLIRLKRSANYLKKYRNKKLNSKPPKINIIIPAMNEVNNIERSVNFFRKLDDYCDVIYVTTSKEVSGATYEEVEKNIKKYKTKNIILLNCPNKVGTMANQINFACKTLKSEDIIGIYNIDSFPKKETFNYVTENISDSCVLQQVSYFDDCKKGIMKSCQNWQNRWSLIYEMGKYLSNSELEFKYTIGHGIFLKKKVLEHIGYWSEVDINEDNEFGFRLLSNGYKIKAIPYLEKADFANNLKIYIKQQSTWVNGPLYAFSYNRNNSKNIRNIVLCFLNFKAFISWWLFPITSIVVLIISLLYCIPAFFVILFLLIIYLSVINYFCVRILKENGYNKQKNTINIIDDLIFFVIHSFGCYITLFKLFIGKNNINNKYNTEK